MGDSTPSSDTSTSTRSSNVKELLRYVEKELDGETATKSSFEVKAFSLVSLNLGIVTLYFALRTQLALWQSVTWGVPDFLLVASTTLALASVVTAAIVALPARVLLLPNQALDKLYTAATSEAYRGAIIEEVLESRIKQLQAKSDTNSRKATLVVVSFCFFGATTVTFISALAWTLLS